MTPKSLLRHAEMISPLNDFTKGGFKEIIDDDYADPKKVKTAKPIKQMTWAELLKITGRKWHPGANVPFDPAASELASQWGMKVIITKGTDIGNFKKILLGKKAKGTIIA